VFLEDEPNLGAEPAKQAAAQTPNILSEQNHVAVVGFGQPQAAAQQRRFAAAVGADQCNRFALAQTE